MEQIKSEMTALRLSGMTETFKTLQESRKMQELSLLDGLRILLQGERDQREARRYARLLKMQPSGIKLPLRRSASMPQEG